MKKMSLGKLAEPQCQPDKMNVESISAAAMRAVHLQLSHGWETDFTLCFDENGEVVRMKLGASEYIHQNGYCVRHSLVAHNDHEQPLHVCRVTAWSGARHQTLSGIIHGLSFFLLCDQPLLSANDA